MQVPVCLLHSNIGIRECRCCIGRCLYWGCNRRLGVAPCLLWSRKATFEVQGHQVQVGRSNRGLCSDCALCRIVIGQSSRRMWPTAYWDSCPEARWQIPAFHILSIPGNWCRHCVGWCPLSYIRQYRRSWTQVFRYSHSIQMQSVEFFQVVRQCQFYPSKSTDRIAKRHFRVRIRQRFFWKCQYVHPVWVHLSQVLHSRNYWDPVLEL